MNPVAVRFPSFHVGDQKASRKTLPCNELTSMATGRATALRIETTLPGAQDIEAMENRVTVLEALYLATRRDDPQSTMHGLYTGLHAPMP